MAGGSETECGEENGERGKEATLDAAEKCATDQKEEAEEDSGDESDSDSDDEGFELHPLLRLSTTPRSSKPSTPTPPATSTTPSTTGTTSTSAGDLRTSDAMSFYSKRLSVNSAPSLEGPRTDHHGGSYSAGHGYHRYPSHQQPYERCACTCGALNSVLLLCLLYLSMYSGLSLRSSKQAVQHQLNTVYSFLSRSCGHMHSRW